MRESGSNKNSVAKFGQDQSNNGLIGVRINPTTAQNSMKDKKNKLSQNHTPISSNNPISNGSELMSIENDQQQNTNILPNNLYNGGMLTTKGGRYDGQTKGRNKVNKQQPQRRFLYNMTLNSDEQRHI